MLAEYLYRGKLFPNNEFTLGKLPPSIAGGRAETPERDPYAIGYDGCDVWGSRFACPSDMRPLAATPAPAQKPTLPGPVPPLDLTYPFIKHAAVKRKQRGSSGMTSYSKRMTRNAVYLLEQRYGKDNLSFLTLTVPNLEEGDLRSLAANFSYSCKLFRQRLERLLVSKGLPKEMAGCIEPQLGRLKKHGQLAYHVHLVFPGRHPGKHWSITPNEIRMAWRETIETVLGRDCEYADWRVCVDLKRIRRSATNYLAKYLSKNAEAVEQIKEHQSDACLPGTWNIISRSLRTAIRTAIVRLAGRIAEWLWERCDEWQRERKSEWVKYCYKIDRVTEDTNVPIVAYVGALLSDISIGAG